RFRAFVGPMICARTHPFPRGLSVTRRCTAHDDWCSENSTSAAMQPLFRLLRWGLLASLGLVPSTIMAQRSAPEGWVSARTRSVDSIFAVYDTARSPGCAVAVIEGGQIQYARGYGLADVANDTPITPHSVFGIA